MKENNFSKACTEMLEVLKYIPDEEFDKIESNFIETLYQEKDFDYDFKIDEAKDFKEQELLPETYDMLAYVYRKYLCNEEEKASFKEALLEKNEYFENLKQKQDSDIEEKRIVTNDNETFFKKIFNWMKKTLIKK